jgi:hypothetical protein
MNALHDVPPLRQNEPCPYARAKFDLAIFAAGDIRSFGDRISRNGFNYIILNQTGLTRLSGYFF